jgi:hypothetical protein
MTNAFGEHGNSAAEQVGGRLQEKVPTPGRGLTRIAAVEMALMTPFANRASADNVTIWKGHPLLSPFVDSGTERDASEHPANAFERLRDVSKRP